LGQLGLFGWQGAMEVCEGAALAFKQTALNLMDENVAAPAVLNGLPRIPFTLSRTLHEVE
jgi:hypothetical protein